LLHEAATKGGSTIKGRGLSIIQDLGGGDLVFYRTKFQEALDVFLENYKQELLTSRELKIAFILKMDDICQMEHIYYFAYGSNMSLEQLKDRVGTIYDKSTGVIKNYAFSYNKKSKDGSSKANITRSESGSTPGVCVELDLVGFKKLQKIEKGYETIEVPFYSSAGTMIISKTFISKSISNTPPNQDYIDKVVQGARENQLPEEYIETVLSNQLLAT
jgi:hypothetical protein